MTTSTTNKLLNALSAESRDRIMAACKPVTLPIRTSLIETGETPKSAYFITSGIASVVVELAEGGSAEVALIGREGLAGATELLGPALPPTHCFIQVSATALRMPFAELKKIFTETEEVRSRILELVQSQSMSLSQLAACNKLHDAEPRLARWLLMVQDRVEEETLNITQEFLAQMLGTQRTTVVMAAGALQRRGLISYSRGKVKIHSRKDLEAAACDCYKISQRLYSGLYR